MNKSVDNRIKEIDKALLKRKGTIFDIQKFSIQDGPGIRTTVFLKGCPLHCAWCHNPESICIEPQIRYESNYDAVTVVGREVTVEELLSDFIKDEVFYQNSDGGITLSGGEATIQLDFAEGILKGARELGLHTVLDTCGYVSYNNFLKLITHIDLILYDIKHMDEEEHIKGTGVSNKLILDNLKELDKTQTPIWIRIPLIPGYNDSIRNMKKTAVFLSELENVKKVDLLAYHKLGENKYKEFNMDFKLEGIESPSKERLDYLYNIIKKNMN